MVSFRVAICCGRLESLMSRLFDLNLSVMVCLKVTVSVIVLI